MDGIDFRRTVLSEGAVKFIATFLRFEFALKEHRYLPREGDAMVDWARVANDLQEQGFFEAAVKSGKASTILTEPPKKQISRERYLDFAAAVPPKNCNELLVAVRRVRNNLLHGGKSGDPEGNERNRTLVAEAQWVVEEALRELPEVRGASVLRGILLMSEGRRRSAECRQRFGEAGGVGWLQGITECVRMSQIMN